MGTIEHLMNILLMSWKVKDHLIFLSEFHSYTHICQVMSYKVWAPTAYLKIIDKKLTGKWEQSWCTLNIITIDYVGMINSCTTRKSHGK